MSTLKKRYVVAIVALAAATPLALYLQYDVPPGQSLEQLKEKIPTAIGPWVMIAERGPTDDERRILETDAILTRTYAAGAGSPCDLSIVFSKDNRRVAHPPEICYKGSGWSVEENEVIQFPVEGFARPFEANRLLLLQGGQRLHVLYWFKAGPAYSASYLRMQWNIIKAHFTHRGSSSALIRVSATCQSPDEDAQVLRTLRGFAALAIPAVTAAME